MAKTGIHIKRANVGSVEAHNLRTTEYLEGLEKAGCSIYFFQDQTHLNQSWINPNYVGKSCQDIFGELVNLYTQKVGQKPNLQDRTRINKKTGKEYQVSGWSPIREGVIPITENTTLDDFQIIKEWAESKGLDIIRIDIHHDEGYRNEATGETKYNRHAHIVFDWVDHQTGKTLKLDDKDMSELQDVVAESLQMERGRRKSETGLEHVEHIEYRERKAEYETKRLEDQIRKQKGTIKQQETNISNQIDKINELQELAEQRIGEAQEAIELAEQTKEYKSTLEKEKAFLEQNKGKLEGEIKELEKRKEDKQNELLKEAGGAIGYIAKKIIGIKEKKEQETILELEAIEKRILRDLEQEKANLNKQKESHIKTKFEVDEKRIFDTIKLLDDPQIKKAIEITVSAFQWGIKTIEPIKDLINGKLLYIKKGVEINGEIVDEETPIQTHKTQGGGWAIFARIGDAWLNMVQFVQNIREKRDRAYRESRAKEIAKAMNMAHKTKQNRNRGRGL